MADRVEREVEEILRKLDDFVPEQPTPIRSPRRTLARKSRAFTAALPRISWKHLLLWGLLIALVFFFFPLNSGAFVVLGVLGLFFVYFLFMRPGRVIGSQPPPKVWRGQPLDLTPSGPSWTDRLRSKLKGGPRR